MKPKPTILELCCGWKSVSNAFATNHHWHTVTVDILPKFKPTLLTDVTRWDYRAYFETHPVPDVIWASPPCRTFTVQAWGRYRDSEGGAVGMDGEDGDACVRACLACIEHCLSLNPNLTYFVENPLHGAVFYYLESAGAQGRPRYVIVYPGAPLTGRVRSAGILA